MEGSSWEQREEGRRCPPAQARRGAPRRTGGLWEGARPAELREGGTQGPWAEGRAPVVPAGPGCGVPRGPASTLVASLHLPQPRLQTRSEAPGCGLQPGTVGGQAGRARRMRRGAAAAVGPPGAEGDRHAGGQRGSRPTGAFPGRLLPSPGEMRRGLASPPACFGLGQVQWTKLGVWPTFGAAPDTSGVGVCWGTTFGPVYQCGIRVTPVHGFCFDVWVVWMPRPGEETEVKVLGFVFYMMNVCTSLGKSGAWRPCIEITSARPGLRGVGGLPVSPCGRLVARPRGGVCPPEKLLPCCLSLAVSFPPSSLLSS